MLKIGTAEAHCKAKKGSGDDGSSASICLSTTVSSAPRHARKCIGLLNRPEYIRCLMGYIVDLTLILQAVVRLCSPSRVWFTENTQDRVNEIIYMFYYSEKRNRIHKAIRDFVSFQRPLAKRRVLDKITSLIRENQVRSLMTSRQFTAKLIFRMPHYR
jgi:hypothetical protein